MSDFIITAGGTALISSLIIQWMKSSKFSIFDFLGVDKTKSSANFSFSILVAFITSIGIGYKYDSTAGTLMLTGLTAAGIQHGLWHWFIQWVSQHIAYKSIIVPTELQAANVNMLKQLLAQLEENKPK